MAAGIARGVKVWVRIQLWQIRLWKKYKHVVRPYLASYPEVITGLEALELLYPVIEAINPLGPE